MTIRGGALVLAVAVFLVNPGLGCGSDEFSFGAEDMRLAVEGTWEVSAPGSPDPLATFILTFAPAEAQAKGLSVVQRAACTTRSFIPDAGACGPTSTMQFYGRVLGGSPEYDGQLVSASFSVSGLDYRGGGLYIAFAHGPSLFVRMNAQNEIVDAHLSEGMMQAAVLARKD